MSVPVMTAPPASAQAAAAAANQTKLNNALYLQKCPERVVLAASPGGALNQAFAAGTALNFTVGDVNNAYLKRLRFIYSVTFTYTPGTGSAAVNAAAPYSIVREVDVFYNGQHIRTNPYFIKVREEARKFGGFSAYPVVAAPYQNNATVNTMLRSYPALASGSNTWTFIQELPLNALNPLDPSGMVPLSGVGNEVQVTVNCAQSITGADPLMNAIALTGNATITAVTGTVTVQGIITDGLTMDGPNRLDLDLSQVPTTQWWWDNPLTNMTAGGMRRNKLLYMLKHAFIIAIVIDGQQSNTFVSSENNFTGFELDADASGQQYFHRYGTTLGSNIGIDNYYERVRTRYGQDFDPGVLIMVDALAVNVPDIDNQNGSQTLDMTPSGWPGVNYGVYLGTVNTGLGINPRVEVLGIGTNPSALQGG